MGVALDACTRGYSTLLVEQADYGQATSSRSTKLIHGGVRYLRQGNISLVREALRERGRLLANASEVVHKLPIVIPAYKPLERYFFRTGMWMYDRLAGSAGIGNSSILSPAETQKHLPGLRSKNLRGGVLLFDGQFDDARLLISLRRTIEREGGQTLNHHRVTKLIHHNERIVGAHVEATHSGVQQEVRADRVINTTGIFSDDLRNMADADSRKRIRHSRGSHVVLPRSVLPSDTALLIPETRDGRVLFLIPWLGKTLLGTTDIPVDKATLEPKVTDEEAQYLLEHARKYIDVPADVTVMSRFAGLRPLVASNKGGGNTASLSRHHVVEETAPGLISVMGGKWTTFRKMAEDAVDAFAEGKPCRTREMALEIAPAYTPPLTREDVFEAVKTDHARRLEDVLSRRSRWLLLDAAACRTAAKPVAEWMAEALGEGPEWVAQEYAAFMKLAEAY